MASVGGAWKALTRVAHGILPVVAEESTNPDPVELRRRAYEAVNRRDLDALLSF